MSTITVLSLIIAAGVFLFCLIIACIIKPEIFKQMGFGVAVAIAVLWFLQGRMA